MYQRFIHSIMAAGLDVHCVEIFHRGKIVLKHCFHEDKPYPIYSATKSVTAAAVLIAQGEGKLDIADELYKYLDSKYTDIIPEEFKRLKFTDFMTMTAAPYPFRPQNAAELVCCPNEKDWLENILKLPIDYSDRRFNYSNIPAYLVSAACENAVDRPLADHLATRLFEPLGWGRPVFQTSPEGHFYGATGMELTVSQLARLGQLFLQKGRWDGVQLIPEELALQAVCPKVVTEGDSYGYFFWVSDNTFEISGKWGQCCVVCPQKQLMVTYLSHEPGRRNELTSLARDLVQSFHTDPDR